MELSDDHCLMCGRRLVDTRSWLVRKLWPRFPRCTSNIEACYRGLAERMGFVPTEEQVRQAVEYAQRGMPG